MARGGIKRYRDLLPDLKELISIISEASVDAAELEISNNRQCATRLIKQFLILEGKSKAFRKKLQEVRFEIIDGRSKIMVDEVCDGYKLSDCCNAAVDPDILICSDCKEHCGLMCDSCDDNNCENK